MLIDIVRANWQFYLTITKRVYIIWAYNLSIRVQSHVSYR